MKKIVLIALLTLLNSSNLFAEPLIYLSGESLMKYCNNSDTESLDRGICEGYLTGIMDSVTTITYWKMGLINTCANDELTPFQLRNTVAAWAQSHPEDLKGAASAMVLNAFIEKHACR